VTLPLALRLAFRDLRSGLSGLHILVICVTLGVTAIAAIGSLSESVRQGLEREGQPLLGGDIEIALVQRQMSPEERRALAPLGTIGEVASLRAMASSGSRHALVEIKAVGPDYPLYGELALNGGLRLKDVLALRNTRFGIAIDPLLLERFGLKLGDTIAIGETDFDARASILREPDRLSDGIAFGPRVLMSHDALATTGLLKPGSLVSWRYRFKLHDPMNYAEVSKSIDGNFPQAGWRVRTRAEAAPGVNRYLERLTFFLTLVGLTTLVIGGVGISNAVKSFIDRRRRQIAILRLIGTPPMTVFATYLWEVMIVASGATILGLLFGASLPFLIAATLGKLFPVPLHNALYPEPLALAAAFGLLTAFAFALWPLTQAKAIGPLELVRRSSDRLRWPDLRDVLLLFAGLAGLIALAFIGLEPDRLVFWYVLGLGAGFFLLIGLGAGLVFLAARLAKPANALLRFALANLYRPGTALPSVVLSLGLGLTLFVTLSLIDRALTEELRDSLSAAAPSYFFLDVDKSETSRFLSAVQQEASVGTVVTAPMLRGRITRVKDRPAAQVRPAPEGAWALRGDRGLTFADDVPNGSRLIAGQWWPKDYQGPPLVSFTADVAKAIGLGLGDTVSVNVLGRELTATVANLREVDWRTLGMNFVMVFSPNALAAAPHSTLVTVSLAPDREAAFLDRIMQSFPTVTAIRVKDALDAVAALIANLLLAIRGVSALTILTGLLVLAGALTTSLSTRTYDAAVLKTFGATRAQLIAVFALEFATAGLATALFAIIAGTAAAYAICRYIFEIPFAFSAPTALSVALAAMALTIAAGLLTAWAALNARPAVHLRED
jgi:putative ABC transport system permease protein